MKLRSNDQKWKSFCQAVTNEEETRGGEEMIGAVVFVIAFVLFLVISLVVNLPPGFWVVQEMISDIQGTQYESLVSGIINGVIYGVIIWIIYSLVKMFYDRRKGGQKTVVETK